jgi:isoleucyl-tRNA synthetase
MHHLAMVRKYPAKFKFFGKAKSGFLMKEELKSFSIQAEEEIREFWEKEKIQEKARKQNAGKKPFFMIDGPPYASGHIHMGTALNKILKDIIIRSKRMEGFEVRDQPGYDTHGLPIENKVEKKLDIKNKKEIEELGIDRFVKECKTFATEFIDVMNAEFDNLGVWMDWQNPYLTLNNDYIEAIWWTFKKAHEKKLLYLGKYSVHVCPHCETAVAYNEIDYVKQTDTSVFVKYKLKDEKNTFLIIWTTTPWTLPANMGVMVNPEFEYAFVELSNGETWVIAKELVQKIMDAVEAGYTVKKVVKGKELKGLHYENSLAPHLKLPEFKEDVFRVILSERYVNLEEGTGLVHTAPGHGKEDYEEGKKNGLPIFAPVGLDGVLTKEAGDYAGQKARAVDPQIISDLENSGHLVLKQKYTHDYPVCWRCKTPLLMIATPQWFFKITAIQDKLKNFNKEVYWVPSWGKDRFANWLDSLGDWPVSRQRYWGSPLPIWMCEKCEKQTVVGSIKELGELTKLPKDLDLHKPWIDEVTIKCECGGTQKRVPEVLDVWFDSSVAAWGSLKYPERADLFEKFFPANVNLEGKDQIRGWWNSQLIASTIAFDKKPFESIVMHGMILDVSKEKMSKSKGNIVTPNEVIQKYNRDFLRFYLASNAKGEDMVFDWNHFKDVARFFNTFWNTYNFAKLYLDLKAEEKIDAASLEPEDKWILSKLQSLKKECIQNYDGYTFPKVVSSTEYFVLEELSRTYIKLVRDRVDSKTHKALSQTMSEVVFSLVKLLAPIAPHITEYIYQDLREKSRPESVHFLELPKPDESLFDSALEKQVEQAKEISQSALNLREEEKLRKRWPLNELIVKTKTGKELDRVLGLIASMCNVKKAAETAKEPKGNFASKKEGETAIYLDINAGPELKDEWELTELRRRIQEKRKEAKFSPSEKVTLFIDCDDKKFLEKFGAEIEEQTNTKISKKSGEMVKVLERSFFIELKR